MIYVQSEGPRLHPNLIQFSILIIKGTSMKCIIREAGRQRDCCDGLTAGDREDYDDDAPYNSNYDRTRF